MKLSCVKATELIEKKELFGLSMLEGLKLKVHLSMCTSCKEYGKQSRIIDDALRKSNTPNPDVRFSDSEKLELIRKCCGEK